MRTDSGLVLGNNGPILGAEGFPTVLYDAVVPNDPGVYRPMIEIADRRVCGAGTVTSATQVLRLSYFFARRPFFAKTLGVCTAGTAAATVTLIRCGLYTVAANGDITLVASGTNDTSGNSATNTEYTQAITSPAAGYQLVAGARYAFAYLFVGTTAPVLVAPAVVNAGLQGTHAGPTYALAGTVAAQSDLPATVANGSITVAVQQVYCTLQ